MRSTRAPARYLSANGQLAARAIGSEVGFVKSLSDGAVVPHAAASAADGLAASARLGMATGFRARSRGLDAEGDPVLDDSGQPVVDTIRDLPASERFFAGGDTTVRGFALDQLGTPATIDQDGFPIGGNALVILNAELRVPVRGGFGVVGFFDAGNVFARTTDDRSGAAAQRRRLWRSLPSPVGPIRVDMGFKMNRRDIVPGRAKSATACTSAWDRRSEAAEIADADADSRWHDRALRAVCRRARADCCSVPGACCRPGGAGAVRGDEIIDRVLAVVAGDLIMLSDVHGGAGFGLVAARVGTGSGASHALAADRSRADAGRSGTLRAARTGAAAVDRELRAVRARVSVAEAFQPRWRASASTRRSCARRCGQNLRIRAYLEQRFTVAGPSDEEIAAYYREHRRGLHARRPRPLARRGAR